MDSEDLELAGVAEISQEFGVARTTVSMWRSRRETSGFPAPLEELSAGPVYDMNAVRAWHRSRYGSEEQSE